MSDIRITCYGHACFGISCNGRTVILDPYGPGSVPGMELPEGLKADRVYCSHGHGDHNAKECIEQKTPDADPFPVCFLTVPHDDVNGAKRGMNKITVMDLDGVTAAHLGDIGRLPTSEEYALLQKADILMIPAGGFYTIDAYQAKQIADTVQARLTILMHYRRDDMGYDVLMPLEEIAGIFTDLEAVNASEVIYEPERVRTIALLPACREENA
ncbi:MAG: MBL fold metallo-hydrolase [Solobacterium sp.]|nr:MBL fold metallo-hydrolase [Solobacterium sp.]